MKEMHTVLCIQVKFETKELTRDMFPYKDKVITDTNKTKQDISLITTSK